MQQTKLESLIESVFNILIGYWVAIISQLIIFPAFGVHIPFTTNLIIGGWFTLVSLLRSYLIRRWFNAGLHKLALTTAKTFLKI